MMCELNGISIYYEIHGEGAPIVMIHGFEVDHRVMKGCMEPIFDQRKGYKRIYFDLPGMGKTPKKSWIKSSDDILEVVLDFIDKIIPNQKFIIASESYGCYLARGVIQKRFRNINGVLFICPVIFAQPEIRELPAHDIILEDPKLLSDLPNLEAASFKNLAVVQTKTIWERFNNEFFSGVKVAEKDFLEFIWENNYPFSFNGDQIDKKCFDKPALFLMGRQDSMVGYRDAWKIIEHYPRATFVVLDSAGHLLQIEQEKLFNDLVNEWLDRIEKSIN